MSDDLFAKYKNPGKDTYNGLKMLADLSGLDEAEIKWRAARIQQLMIGEKLSKTETLLIIKEEAKDKPWLQSPTNSPSDHESK